MTPHISGVGGKEMAIRKKMYRKMAIISEGSPNPITILSKKPIIPNQLHIRCRYYDKLTSIVKCAYYKMLLSVGSIKDLFYSEGKIN